MPLWLKVYVCQPTLYEELSVYRLGALENSGLLNRIPDCSSVNPLTNNASGCSTDSRRIRGRRAREVLAQSLRPKPISAVTGRDRFWFKALSPNPKAQENIYLYLLTVADRYYCYCCLVRCLRGCGKCLGGVLDVIRRLFGGSE